MAPGSFLSVTCLPNGFDRKTRVAQLSVSLLPTIDTISLGDSIFKDWPNHLKDVRASLNKANLLFQSTGAPIPCHIRASTDDSQDSKSVRMWNALFGYQLDKSAKRDPVSVAQNHRTTWMLSHDAATMQYTHLAHRIDRLAAEMSGDSGALDRVNRQQALINLYLNPSVKPMPADNSRLPFTLLLKARQDALDFCNKVAAGVLPPGPPASRPYTSRTFSTLVAARFRHALKILQQGDERLMDIGVYAAFLSCAASLTRHADPTDLTVPNDASEAFNLVQTAATGPDPAHPLPQSIAADALDQAVRYAEFLLYTRRSRVLMPKQHRMPKDSAPPPPPDFHQTIDLLRRFPAILRPLGLVFDVTFDLPTDAIPDGSYQISIDQLPVPTLTAPAVCFWTTADLKRPAGSANGTFCAANFPAGAGATATPSGNNLTTNRYLNLGAVGDLTVPSASFPVYSLITEDAENETHKRVQSAKAESQSGEYHSVVNQPRAAVDSTLDDLPSTRTGGISLMHTQRLDRINRAAQRVADPQLGTNAMPFFADDLILGYRFDVRLSKVKNAPGRWYGLGVRNSTYTFVDEKLQSVGLTWEPASTLEVAADEGYVSAAATMTSPHANDGEAQLQVHQAMFTWSGAGIGYTPTSGKTEAINDDGKVTPVSDKSTHLRMTPEYTRGDRLLQLRFRYGYDVRCRIVDIAGNSASKEETSFDSSGTLGNATVLSVVMQRHEPLRSPQVLLTDALDRTREPGAQSDRLVVRKHRDQTTRALVPPREGLRFAFMHGVVKNNSTEGAFPKIELNNDGSFPSVDDDPKSIEGRDAIFRYSGENSDPDAPFFPDPLVNQLRVKVDSYSVPKGVSLDALNQAISKTMSFYPQGGRWPFCSPCRIRLTGGESMELRAEAKDVLMDDNGPNNLTVAGLVITLPPAAVVTLNVSSAGADVDPTGNSPAGVSIETAGALRSGVTNILALQQATIPPQPYRTQLVASQPSPGAPLRLVNRTRSTGGGGQQTPAAIPALGQDRLGLALLSGHFRCATPPHAITLVHAVEKPLIEAAPQDGCFQFKRDAGSTAAMLRSKLPGEEEIWVSAAKISCRATWTDRIDDVTNDEPTNVSAAELVFEISAADWHNNISVFHHLRDTRAHEIVYQLSATTLFRDYFPVDDAANKFVLESPPLQKMTVCSSVRPPAPVLSYCVPSFAWPEDDNPACRGWVRQRVSAIRCYLERPFLVSGDQEKLAVVLLTEGQTDNPSAAQANYVSRIGQDPLWQTDPTQTLPNALSATALDGCKFHKGLQLAENGAVVDIAAFETNYAPDRKMWFCDIPFNLVGQYTPFVRLAIVRYQPDALNPDHDGVEARISPVVMADFCQIAPNRFAAVQRTGRVVTLTVSGDAYAMRAGGTLQRPADAGTDKAKPSTTPFDNTFIVELQHRWHRVPLDFDPGWRPTTFKVPPPKMVVHDGIATWTFQFTLPESPVFFKYRLLLRECETLYSDSDAARKANTQAWSLDLFQNGSVKPVERMIYLDFFEL